MLPQGTCRMPSCTSFVCCSTPTVTGFFFPSLKRNFGSLSALLLYQKGNILLTLNSFLLLGQPFFECAHMFGCGRPLSCRPINFLAARGYAQSILPRSHARPDTIPKTARARKRKHGNCELCPMGVHDSQTFGCSAVLQGRRTTSHDAAAPLCPSL